MCTESLVAVAWSRSGYMQRYFQQLAVTFQTGSRERLAYILAHILLFL
jgi:hypothetical protein